MTWAIITPDHPGHAPAVEQQLVERSVAAPLHVHGEAVDQGDRRLGRDGEALRHRLKAAKIGSSIGSPAIAARVWR
jgi:hypothetical protein